MEPSLREVVERGDVDALRARLAAEPAAAEAEVRFGEGERHAVPVLHYVCDAASRGLVTPAQALALADALLEAGANPARAYASSGDTYLIAAASLGVEDVGLRLVERGVDVRARGLFGATALHWAALTGLERLARALLTAGAELELRDARYACTPLEWTLHAWREGAHLADRAGLPRVARALVEHGARVPDDALARLAGPDDAPLRAALATG